ncbi:MAG: hypothetical protein GY904_21090 [Planctomycetaceae bacterium]|nr:hypothetical protein [Planctomycetaceae bacterium]
MHRNSKKCVHETKTDGLFGEAIAGNGLHVLPQGGVVSPILSNVFLHYVLDVWFEEEVKPRLVGPDCLIRFADDFAIGVRHERDDHRIMKVLPKRFAKHGLKVHPDKTRLICFRSPSLSGDEADHSRVRPETFTLLGFTHYWGRHARGTGPSNARPHRVALGMQSIAQ